MTPEAKQTIEELGMLFKGPMETPKGKGSEKHKCNGPKNMEYLCQ